MGYANTEHKGMETIKELQIKMANLTTSLISDLVVTMVEGDLKNLANEIETLKEKMKIVVQMLTFDEIPASLVEEKLTKARADWDEIKSNINQIEF